MAKFFSLAYNSVNYVIAYQDRPSLSRKEKQKQKNKKPSIKPKTKQNKTKQVPHIDENYSFSQSIADKQCKHSKKKIEISTRQRCLSIEMCDISARRKTATISVQL